MTDVVYVVLDYAAESVALVGVATTREIGNRLKADYLEAEYSVYEGEEKARLIARYGSFVNVKKRRLISE